MYKTVQRGSTIVSLRFATGGVKSVLPPSSGKPTVSPDAPSLSIMDFKNSFCKEGASGGTLVPRSKTPCCGKPLRAFTTTHKWKRL